MRIGLAASPAADVVAGLCVGGGAWTPEVVRTAAASVCVYTAGMVLNDHADRAEDAIHRPERPIPAGEVAPTTALALGLSLLVAGVLLSALPWLHLGLAAGVLTYDYVLKRRAPVWVGGLMMGALRAANLLAGVALAGAIDEPLGFGRLAWIAAGVYAVYVLCVTILGSFEDLDRIPQRAVRSIQTIPPSAAALVLVIAPDPWPAAAVGGVLALLFLARAARVDRTWDRGSVRASMGFLLLGTMLYTSLLCMAHGRNPESAAILAVAFVMRWLTRRLPLT